MVDFGNEPSKFERMVDSLSDDGIDEVPDDPFSAALALVSTRLQQRARNQLYYDNPHIWAKEVIGFVAWSKQRDIGKSIVDHSFTAVKSCHGAGKSAWAAVIVCWFIATRLAAGEKVFVITTAPTYAQVHLVLWEEIRDMHARGNLPGYITSGDEWKIKEGDRIKDLAVGRKPADTDKNGFQGKHADNLLIVLDEANGIPKVLYTGATSMLTGDMTRQKMLAIGNPDDPNSEFGQNDALDKRRRRDGKKPIWNTIQIKAWDTPNFTEEKHELPAKVLSSVLQETWVEARREDWGTEDMRWTSKIEAEFPEISADSLFSTNLIEQAKSEIPDPEWDRTEARLGVDVSRFGNDRTVLVLMKNGVATVIDFWGKKDTLETANRIHTIALEHHVTEIRVDEKNMGAGVVDFLASHQGYNYRVIGMDASTRSPNPKRWINARSYWYDNLREQMLKNQIQIKADKIPHRDLEKELSVIRYGFKNGALQVEGKDEIKKRLDGLSPDFADALVYAAADLSGLVAPPHEEQGPVEGDTFVIDVLERSIRNSMNDWTVSPV